MQSAALQVVIWIAFATHSPATKWSLGYTGRSESNSHWAGTAREVTRWMKAFSQPLPQSPQNSHQPGKKLSFYPKWGEIKKSDITDSRRMLLTDKLLLFFFTSLSRFIVATRTSPVSLFMLNAELGFWDMILKAILEFRLFGSSASVAFIFITIVPEKKQTKLSIWLCCTALASI